MDYSTYYYCDINNMVNFMFSLLYMFSKTVRIMKNYFCFVFQTLSSNRSTNRYNHKISKRPTRRIDILAREQDHYLRPSLSSLAFDGPYAESLNSSSDDQQRVSINTASGGPELQVRRLSEQDWPHFAMHNPYGLTTHLSESPLHSTNSNRPI